jgi:molybdopterin-binding protein
VRGITSAPLLCRCQCRLPVHRTAHPIFVSRPTSLGLVTRRPSAFDLARIRCLVNRKGACASHARPVTSRAVNPTTPPSGAEVILHGSHCLTQSDQERPKKTEKDRPGVARLRTNLPMEPSGTWYSVWKARQRSWLRKEELMRMSARNQLRGTVKSVKHGAVVSEVVVDLGNGQELVSVITRESAEQLGLAPGTPVVAIIKATEVMVAVE